MQAWARSNLSKTLKPKLSNKICPPNLVHLLRLKLLGIGSWLEISQTINLKSHMSTMIEIVVFMFSQIQRSEVQSLRTIKGIKFLIDLLVVLEDLVLMDVNKH